MRLIDADALFEALVTGDIRESHQFCYPCKKVLEAIDAQPTVDPQPEITLESAIDYLHSIGWMQEHDELMYKQGYKHGKSKGIKRGMAIARRKHEEQST